MTVATTVIHAHLDLIVLFKCHIFPNSPVMMKMIF